MDERDNLLDEAADLEYQATLSEQPEGYVQEAEDRRTQSEAIRAEYKARADQLGRAANEAFRAACTYDGLEVGSPIVVFSNDNPHAAEYDERMTRYLQYRRDHNV